MTSPNILIVSIDSLRADAVSRINTSLNTTPFFDTLSSESTLYTRAFSQAVWTVPSHTSVFTGLYPAEHRIIDESAVLGDHPTLASKLKEVGYTTGADFRLDWLDGGGILRGFDYEATDNEDNTDSSPVEIFEKTLDKVPQLRRVVRSIYRGSFRGHIPDKSIITSAINTINSTSEPFCHFVHLNDAHWPYSPTSPFHRHSTDKSSLQLFWNRAYTQQKLFGTEGVADISLTQRELDTMKDLYLGSVRQVDDHLETLLSEIDSEKLENTIVVVFGDHGEAFGEEGDIGHNNPIPCVTHVPLLIKDPTGSLAQGEVSSPVQLIDIYPTISELVGIETPKTNARDLTTTDSTKVAFSHADKSQSGPYPVRKFAVWRSPTDYIVWNSESNETERNGKVEGLEEHLNQHLDSLLEVPPEGERRLDRGAERRLRDLGYLE